MRAGIDIIVDTFETSGIAKKNTLEKFRRRAKQQISKSYGENKNENETND